MESCKRHKWVTTKQWPKRKRLSQGGTSNTWGIYQVRQCEKCGEESRCWKPNLNAGSKLEALDMNRPTKASKRTLSPKSREIIVAKAMYIAQYKRLLEINSAPTGWEYFWFAKDMRLLADNGELTENEVSKLAILGIVPESENIVPKPDIHTKPKPKRKPPEGGKGGHATIRAD